MIFAEVIFPILEDIGAFISSFLEVFTTKFQIGSMENAKKIAKAKKEIENMHNEEEVNTRIVGFSIPSTEEQYEEEEDV